MMTKIGDLEDYDDAPLDDALAVWQFVSAVHHCYHPEVGAVMTKIMRWRIVMLHCLVRGDDDSVCSAKKRRP